MGFRIFKRGTALMKEEDILEYISFLFLAYATGWFSAYLIYVYKRLVDYI